MKINISYSPHALELAKVSAFFLENKPLFRISIGFVTLFAGLIFCLAIVKLAFSFSLTPDEILALVTAGFWLLGRRKTIEQIFYFRMKRSPFLNDPLLVEVTLNGITWSGKKIRTEGVNWREISFAFEVKNGFIIPNSPARFLWLPFRGFSSDSDIHLFREALVDHKIEIRQYPKVEY